MHIPYFGGVFIRNALSTSCARQNESGIVNLDDATGLGTHWVMYAKKNNCVVYFDSFGNLRLPKELVRYFGNGATSTIACSIEYTIRAFANKCVCGFYGINGRRA